jgi:serine/threonine protein kinase
LATTVGLEVGCALAGYRIERLLGRGGMSAVYLAHDLRLGRKVALKVLAPDLSLDEGFREEFGRESRRVASLDHSGIVPIYEAGEEDGVFFIAMRYADEGDLGTLVRRDGPLEPRRALEIVSQTATALDLAHARGLVHRDVKPANILLAREDGASRGDHVYLSDFGLSGAPSEIGLADIGFSGTANYVSPEQIARHPVGARGDVYSLGCVLYESLTGEVPYRSHSSLAILWAHVHDPPPSASRRRPELPEAIDAVLAKAMAKDPGDRYEGCRQFVAAARDVLAAEDRLDVRGRLSHWKKKLAIVAPLALPSSRRR